MPSAVFGTAHLFGLVDAPSSRQLLRRALDDGYDAYDTAPSYGYGASEPELAAALTAPSAAGRPLVTTKVGLAPGAPARPAVRILKAAARRLPTTVQDRLRSGDVAAHGRFDLEFVRESVERSLARLGRIDRLMLHEVGAGDVEAPLAQYLRDLRQQARIGAVGVATRNDVAATVLAADPDLFDAVHLEVGPFAPAVVLPHAIATIVGHGALGPGGSGLARVRARLAADAGLTDQWRAVTSGTRWAEPDGLAAALLSRAAMSTIAVAASGPTTTEPPTSRSGLSGLIVATSQPDRVTGLRRLAAGQLPLEAPVAAVLDRVVEAEGQTGRPHAGSA